MNTGETVWSKYSEYLKRDLYFVSYSDGLISFLDCKQKLDHRFDMNDYNVADIMRVGCPYCKCASKGQTKE